MPSSLRTYRIQAVSEMTGVATATLRAWERRYGVPNPSRTEMAYRLYSEDDVGRIKQMLELTGQGLAPAQAAKVVLEHEAASEPEVPAESSDDFSIVRTRLLKGVLDSDPQAVANTIAYALAITSAAQAVDRVFEPVLHDVGDRWQRGEIGIAQEHMLASALTSALGSIVTLMSPAPGFGHILLACADEELHALPLLVLGVHLSTMGARCTMLGQRTPPEAVAHAVKTMQPDAVGLSVTAVPPSAPTALFRNYAKACGDVPWGVGGALVEKYRKEITAPGGIVFSGRGDAAARELAALARGRTKAKSG